MQRSTLPRFALLFALPLASLLFACGSGGDKKVALDEWVADLCDIAADFEDAAEEAGEEFEEADFDDTEEAKEAFANSVDEQKKAQKDFRSAFNKIGRPDIEGGEEVVKAFEEQFDEHDELTDKIADKIADIDDDDDFLVAFLEIAGDLEEPDFREKLDEVAEDNDEVQDLIDAIDDEEDCAETIFDDATAAQDPTPAVGSRTPVGGGTVTIRTPTPAAANTTNEKWVSGICLAFGGWVRDIDRANGTFQTALDRDTGDAASKKKLLVDFLKQGRSMTQSLQLDVKSLKAPEVKDGAQIHKVFVDVSDDLVKAMNGFVADAEKISTASAAQTVADIDRLIDSIGVTFDKVAESFDKLDNLNVPQLEALFDARPECAGF